MTFSIVTPSYRNSEWLKLCVASVADQTEVPHEHIVQDAGSEDGTLDWLTRDPRVAAFVEKDRGMYDAVNRGWRRARGEFLAYLNCDEQYLPGALKRVADFFARCPEVEVVFSDSVVVDAQGRYGCDRRALAPQLWHSQVSGTLSFLTAALFLRRRVLDQHGLFFDENWRDLGDAEWTVRLVKSGLRMAVLPEFTSVFTETGQNMNLGANAARERHQFLASAPWGVRVLRSLVVAHFRLRRWRAGHYRGRPYDYAIFTRASPAVRRSFHVSRPTFRWTRPAPASLPSGRPPPAG